MRHFILALSVLSLVGGSIPAYAATQCRDSKGKFVKCPQKKSTTSQRCRDSHGKYAKCGTAGAKPA